MVGVLVVALVCGCAGDEGGLPDPGPPAHENPRSDPHAIYGGDGKQHEQVVCEFPRAADAFTTGIETGEGTVNVRMWIPRDVCFVRCAIVSAHGTMGLGSGRQGDSQPFSLSLLGEDADTFLRANGCAMVEIDRGFQEIPWIDRPGDTFDVALAELAAFSGREEVEYAPYAVVMADARSKVNPERSFGEVMESRGERVVGGIMMGCAPQFERPLGAVPYLFTITSGRDANGRCPYYFDDSVAEMLERHPLMGVYRRDSSHYDVRMGTVGLPFLHEALALRLPDRSPESGPVPLLAVAVQSGHVANMAYPHHVRAGDEEWPVEASQTSWFPGNKTAQRWRLETWND